MGFRRFRVELLEGLASLNEIELASSNIRRFLEQYKKYIREMIEDLERSKVALDRLNTQLEAHGLPTIDTRPIEDALEFLRNYLREIKERESEVIAQAVEKGI